LVIYPLSSTYINNNYANEYKNETINLFKKINPNIKKVVNPRRQIDEIIKSYNLSEDNRLDISGIESIKRLDIPEITKVNLNVDNSEAKLTLSKLGSAQYKFLINILPQSNLVLLNEDIETKDGKVSGTVLIKFSI
jgi:type II secretory pathway component PulL